MTLDLTTYYATAAVAIPVFLLVYLVQLREWAEQELKLLEADNPSVRELIVALLRRLWGLLAWIVPAGAEIACFFALANESSSSGTVTFVGVGLGLAGITVLFPLLYAQSVKPTFVVMRQNWRQLRSLRSHHHKMADSDDSP